MSEKIKVGIDNRGYPVYTDGELYVGFETRNYDWILKTSGLSDYLEFDEKEIIKFGIDKITDWEEL